MDRAIVQRLVEGFRQMPAEELARRYADRDTLEPEARQAIVEAVTTHPDCDAITRSAALRSNSERPSLGFWLGVLVFQFCAIAVLTTIATWILIEGYETAAPQPSGSNIWTAYRWISWANSVAVAIAAVLAVRSLLLGKSRQSVNRVICCLWFNSIGSLAIDVIADMVFFGTDATGQTYFTRESIRQQTLSIVISILWTGYLLNSKRCRQRYPRI